MEQIHNHTTASAANQALLQEQQASIRALAQRDREVRSHEQAHAAAGGAHAGHPNYQFTKGPNGVRYASSGHVNIDISVVAGDPQATLDKMQTVQRAALAPAQPSAQDRAVAAKAAAQAAQARAEIARQHNDSMAHEVGTNKPGVNATTATGREFGGTTGSLIDLFI